MPFLWNPKPEPDQSPDLTKVRALCSRLADPYWMRQPKSWVWPTPDGTPQGFGFIVHRAPGLANLLWLALELDRPPSMYEARENGLYMLIMAEVGFAQVGGEPLADLAAALPLREFVDQLPDEVESPLKLERALPLLKMLGQRRLSYANT